MFERTVTPGTDTLAEIIRQTIRDWTSVKVDNATVDGEFLVKNRGKVYIVQVRYIPDLNK